MATLRGARFTRAKGREYVIIDKAALSRAVRGAVKRRFGGNRNRAAIAVGIPHTTLKGYEERRTSAIRHETFERLHRLVGSAHSAPLEAALLTPRAQEVLRDYDEWLVSEMRVTESGAKNILREINTPDEDVDWLNELASIARGGETQLLGKFLQQRYAHLWAPLKRKLQQRGHFRPRAALAFYRVVAPLVHAGDSGGIERDYTELSGTELRQFIRAGVRREIILLDRENDVRRAQARGTDDGAREFLTEQMFRESAGRKERQRLPFYPPAVVRAPRAASLLDPRARFATKPSLRLPSDS